MKTLARYVFSFLSLSVMLSIFASLSIPAKAATFVFSPRGSEPAQPSSNKYLPVMFDRLTTSDGLSEGSITDMVQDAMGFMWFATQFGLNKYDGYRFTVYTHDPDDPNSLSANNLRVLHLGRDQTLWVGTFDGGLNRLDRTTNRFTYYRHNLDDPNSLSDDYVRAIHEDTNGNLWVGTQNGLNRLDSNNQFFRRYHYNSDKPRSLAHDRIYSLVVDRQGNLWAATAGGLCQYVPQTDDFQCFQHDPNNPQSLSHNVVFVAYPDSKGIIWAATAGGLSALDPQNGRVVRYQHNPNDPRSLSSNEIHAIVEDREGRLWVGTFIGGLNLFDRSTQTFTSFQNDPDDPNSLSGDNILDLYEDRSGILWIGTWAGDLSFVDTARHKFKAVSRLSIPAPLAIQDDENYLWVGTFEDGLFQIDRESLSIRQYQHDPAITESVLSNEIYAFHHDKEGVLWIGTGRGLDRFDAVSQQFIHPYAEESVAIGLNEVAIVTLFQDSRGWLWIGTQNDGLFCLDFSVGKFNCYQRDNQTTKAITSGQVFSIRENEDGSLWIGGDSGLYHLDPLTGNTKHYTRGETFATSVTSVQHDTDGSLWLGTWGGGLNHFDPTTQTFSHYDTKDGLPSDLVFGILKDRQDRLWISTSNGLSLFNPGNRTFRTYDKLDGLPENGFNQGAYFQNERGEMFFGGGGNAGFVVAFSPEDIVDNSYVPPVALTGFQLFNKPVTIGGQSPMKRHPNHVTDLTLAHDQSVFSFEYAALNFSAPAKNQYAYKMEGFESDWNYVGDRRLATYTNLDPGTYIFRVIASNNDGVWNNDGLSVHLTITPPWWRTWWAYLLYIVLGIATVAGYIRFRTRAQERELKIQRRELAYERQLRESMERVDRSKDEERARIAREMHDGLAQTLAGLRFRVRTWTTMLSKDPTKLSAELSDAGPILDETLQELRRIIFALRPVMLDEMGLVQSITQVTDNIIKHYPVKIHTCIEGDEALLSPSLAHNTFRIVQESLHNAVRHAQANNIWLNVTIRTEQVELEVRDDGVGFDLALIEERAKQGHFGLVNVRHRAETLKGTATITSAIGQGTTVRATLPMVTPMETTE